MTRNKFEILEKAILKLYPTIDTISMEYLLSNCEPLQFQKKQIIIQAEAAQSSIFFLTSGLVRGYYINDNGDEINIRFLNNEGWITHYSALLSGLPSKYTFQALEESTAISLLFSAIQEGYLKHKGLERFGRLVAENVLQTQQERIESFQFLNAEERYLQFSENYPELFNRISLSYLCTYLGIQRQSLSRIRKKIAAR